MIGQHGDRRRIFTVDQANAALPLIRAIVADLVRLACEVSDRSERLSVLLDGRQPPSGDDPYTEKLVHVTEELERDRRRLQEYADELLELGVEPKSAVEGLVDFPSIRAGRTVYLCWKLGESEVLFWHDVEAGYAGRRPLVAGTLSGDGSAVDERGS